MILLLSNLPIKSSFPNQKSMFIIQICDKPNIGIKRNAALIKPYFIHKKRGHLIDDLFLLFWLWILPARSLGKRISFFLITYNLLLSEGSKIIFISKWKSV